MKNKFFLLLIVLLPLAGCTTHQTPPSSATQKPVETNLSVVTAEFTTHVYRKDQKDGKKQDALTHWQLWRSPTRVEWLDVAANISEIWTQTSQDLWFYSKAYHTDKQVIEYSPVDLNLLQVARAWRSFAAAINPDILQNLSNTKQLKALDGFQRVQYRGTIDHVVYEVDWLPELSLASRVKTLEAGVTQITKVKQPLAIANDLVTPQDISRYRFIEYSDLGDMERDPFVIKVQHSLLGAHDHDH